MSRQSATLLALGGIALAALVLSVGSWVTLWRHLKERRRARARNGRSSPPTR
jgi:type II secretory pathway component PulL